MNIKKGDNVKILRGKNSGKTGKVLRVDPKLGMVTVEGVNIYKKHVRPKRQEEKGQMVELVRPLDVSKVQLVCPSCNKSTRIGIRSEGKSKVRYCRKCNAAI
jgi:large subunit ribosomal protein L24